MTNRCIGVLGCGWLGFPLALDFIAKGYTVKGTTTSPKKLSLLTEKGIEPYLIKVSENQIDGDISGFLSGIDILIINIPPNLRKDPNVNYVKKIELLCAAIKKFKAKNLIFISSTSVYGEQEGEITEEAKLKPNTASGKQLVNAEQLFNQLDLNCTIIRFGGLIGPDRHPVYNISKKKVLKNGNELVNLIHLDDCIYMICTIIEEEYWGEIFNGVYPYHPKKREYYKDEALKINLILPQYYNHFNKNVNKMIINKAFNSKNHFLKTPITDSFTTKK